MTWDDLLRVVRNGESSSVEFKDERVKPDSVARALVGFLNGRGGRLFIGVGDDGTPVGVTRPGLQTKVMEVASDKVDPPEIPDYREVVGPDGTRVAVVEVAAGPQKPYHAREMGRKTAYVRFGNSTRPATQHQLRRLYQQSGLLHFDETPVVRAGIQVLDRVEVEAFYREVRGRPLEFSADETYRRTLLNQRLATEVEGRAVCTVAGVLLFAPRPGDAFPGAGATWVHYDGLDQSADLVDSRVLDLPLPKLVPEVVRIVETALGRPSSIRGSRRIDRPPLPAESVREAVANAVAHRDYTVAGARIAVRLYDDRLEVQSPGSLPNTVTLEAMRLGISVPRNHVLNTILRDYGLLDAVGQGGPRLFLAAARDGRPDPVLDAREEVFTLTLPLGEAGDAG